MTAADITFRSWLGRTGQFIRDDWNSSPTRFIAECAAWAISIGLAIFMAATVPDSPWVPMYIIWIIGHCLYLWAAWTRGSFGMLANYVALTAIDSVGLVRLLINA